MVQAAQSPLELGARHAEVVQAAIKHWLETSNINEAEASLLAETIVVRGFDWEKFAKYTLRLAVLCLSVAVTSAVFDKSFKHIWRRLIGLPAWLRSGATALIAVGFHVFAYQRSQLLPEKKYANEAIHGVGALFMALAAFQFMEQLAARLTASANIDLGNKESHPRTEEGDAGKEAQERRKKERLERDRVIGQAMQGVLLGLATIYAAVGLLSKSNLIWSCAMIVLGYLFGASSGYIFGTYWLDIDSPLLFMGLGSGLIGIARLMQPYAITAPLWSTTRTWGLLYFFVPLWIMSIYGYDDYFEGSEKLKSRISRKFRMFLWSLAFAAAASVSIWHGLRYDDGTTKGFGLTFLGINLYSKVFEYFWGLSKPVFFALLAGTLAVVGRYAEDVWNMRTLQSLVQ